MAEGEVEKGEGMLATASLHHTSVVKREHDQASINNQESDDDCSSLDSCGDGGNMGVPDSRGHSPSPTLSDPTKQQLNGLLNLSTLSSLQGLTGLQGTAPGPSAASMATSSGIINNQLINTPLNLSLNASNNVNTSNLLSTAQQVLTPPQPTAMPQLILASGQIIQGIQGAQLLIPTSQGIATQTILTIPINAVTNNQMVNMPMSNGQVMTTTLANLAHQYAAHNNVGYNAGSSPTHSGLGPTLPNPLPHLLNGHNQHQHHLLNAFQQQQQAAAHHQQQQQQQHPQLCQPQQQQPIAQPSQKSPLGRSPYSSGMNMGSKSPPVNGLSNGNTTNPSSSPLNTISRLTASNSDLTITTTGPSSKSSNSSGSANSTATASNNNNNSSTTANNNNTNSNNNNNNNSSNNNNTSNNNNNNSSSSGQSTATSLPLHPPPPPPPPYQHSPSPLDLMDESNQPMISESRGNMVDGINLDEIKEFAKAFKLRRLSLGLTQTQVGQALSITEGPAYSQSAICSALATQMYCAAQLASQQQSMFEKLDITPKSAQKIKPVLEQWMKEAEERYKSGQNHLTEFIGVEPSKKRKRRTSFTPQALELLNAHFERNTHPSGTEITTLAHQLGYEREVIRIWFCNKRQALKNTVRMMSKGCT
ncbi:POU-domain protein pdm3 isoform X2 [Rhodnius prolixus]|uniref:POU-domain protein pdm3 isoform X2 n=1 Tax=Rhodnius prolixus TaxID=13249 RepID=UPI003D18F212